MTTNNQPRNGMPLSVAIGPSSFAEEDPAPLELLRQAGIQIIPNPAGRRLNETEIIAHLQVADGLIAGLEPLNAKVFAAAPRLKVIARVGIGMDNVDLAAAAVHGIKVSNTPDGPTAAVAEMTLAALLALSRRIIPTNAALHAGEWRKTIGEGLTGRNVLLIGFGRIGRRVAELLRAFDAVVLACDPALDDAAASAAGVRRVSLDAGLAAADVVSLHAAGSQPLLGAREFGLMRPGVTLLNPARGALIDESALVAALDHGTVAHAWLDVFGMEPYNGPLIGYPQVILTPHVGTYTRQCRLAMETAAVKNLLRDFSRAAPGKNI